MDFNGNGATTTERGAPEPASSVRSVTDLFRIPNGTSCHPLPKAIPVQVSFFYGAFQFMKNSRLLPGAVFGLLGSVFSALLFSNSVLADETDATPSPAPQKQKIYIVQLAEKPLIAYDGSITGLSATKPKKIRSWTAPVPLSKNTRRS